MVWYAAPVLQYMALWLLRLVVCLMEPGLDLIMAVFESFMFLVVELLALVPQDAQDAAAANGQTAAETARAQRAEAMGFSLPEFDAYCARHPEEEICYTAPTTAGASRRMMGGIAYDPDSPLGDVGRGAAEGIQPVGDILLEV